MVNIGFTVDTANIYRAIKDVEDRLSRLTSEKTVFGERVSKELRQRYYSQLSLLRDDLLQVQQGEGWGDKDEINHWNQVAANRIKAINDLSVNPKGFFTEKIGKDTFIEQLSLREKALERFQSITQNFASKIATYFSVGAFITQVYKFANFVQQLDDALTEISTVTGATISELHQYSQDYNQIAQELGRSTVEVAKAAVEFYRQGRSQAETLDLLRATLIGSKISGETAEDTATTLTATINGFQLMSEDAMSIIDKFSALDANMATSFKEMSLAMTRVASSAELTELKIFKLLKNLKQTISSLFMEGSTTKNFLWSVI